MLLAAKFDVPVCPHAGGVGLCEYVQHLAIYDYLCVGASLENRVVEWVDHLHEHFRDPAVVVDGRYQLPQAPGYSIEMLPETLHEYAFPNGPAWSTSGAAREVDRMVTVPARSLPSTTPRRISGTPGPLPPAPGRPARAEGRAGADPADPRRRRQPDDPRLLHEPQHRQRLLTDRRHRAARARAAARHRQPRDRPLGRFDRGPLGSRRRSRLHPRPLDPDRILAVLGTGLAVGLANGLVFVIGRVPHPFIVTLASLSIVRGIALWAANGTLISGMPNFVTRSEAARSTGSRTRSSSWPASRS